MSCEESICTVGKYVLSPVPVAAYIFLIGVLYCGHSRSFIIDVCEEFVCFFNVPYQYLCLLSAMLVILWQKSIGRSSMHVSGLL
jgi:hypothetical protein